MGILDGLRSAAISAGMSWPVNETNRAVSDRVMQTQQSASVGFKVGGEVDMRKKRKVDQAMLYHQAARIYDSGSMPVDGGLSGSTGGTRCYVSDVVNRLIGRESAVKACGLSWRGECFGSTRDEIEKGKSNEQHRPQRGTNFVHVM